MANFWLPQASPDRTKIAAWVVKQLDAQFDSRFHVFVEFSVPSASGRQVDFLILTTTGVYCLEVKDKPYEEVRINGDWCYRDRHTGSLLRDVNDRGENPYSQAIDTADSFRRWISGQHILRRIFGQRSFLPLMDNYHNIDKLKVYPAVIIPPKRELQIHERHNWCSLFTGPPEPDSLTKRKWKGDFEITDGEIALIAEQLGLKRVSALELIPEPDKGLIEELSDYELYCTSLLNKIQKMAPLLDSYVPNLIVETSARNAFPSSLPNTSDSVRMRTVDQLFQEWKQGAKYTITAPGGIGKTTLCLYLCRKVAQEKLKDRNAPFPVYAELRNYRHNEGGLLRLISDGFRLGGLKVDDHINKILEGGRLAVFLDGLDEMNPDDHNEFLIEARRWFELMKHSLIVITTRPTTLRYDPSLAFDHIEIRPFTDEQRREYLERGSHSDKLAILSRFGDSEVSHSPLFLSLFVNLDKDLNVEHNSTVYEAYQAVAEALLQRELAKRDEGDEFDIYWGDLCEIASRLSSQGASRQQVPKSEACEWICLKRMDPSSEKGYRHLKRLLATGLLKEATDPHTLAFVHPLIKSLFRASHLMDQTRGETLEATLSGKLGLYRPLVGLPGLPHVAIVRASLGMEDVFRFILSRLARIGDNARRNCLLDLIFVQDPLLAGECCDVMSREEFVCRAKAALNFGSTGASSCARPRFCPPDAKLLYTYEYNTSVSDELKSEIREYEHPDLHRFVSDESDYRLVVNHSIRELAPLMFERLCRTMDRYAPPYASIDGLRAWGDDRFDTLIETCSSEEVAKIFHLICETGTVGECHNAALLLNYQALRIMFAGIGEEWVEVQEEIDDGSEGWETTESWSAFDEMLADLQLMRQFTESLPDIMGARQLEAVLRILSIFESECAVNPLYSLFETLSFQDQPLETEKERRVLGLIEVLLSSVHESEQIGDLLSWKLLKKWYLDTGKREQDGEMYDTCDTKHFNYVKWGLIEVTRMCDQLRERLIKFLDDSTQSFEAAEGIVRLHFEGVWRRKQCCWRKLPRVPVHLSVHSLKEGVMECRGFRNRDFTQFMQSLPPEPIEFDKRDIRQLIELELSIETSDEFQRAGRLLLARWM